LIRAFTAALFLLLPCPAWADIETYEVQHLPLAEAEAAVRSQLSGHGSVAAMPSRNLLIINDDAVHIRAARELLERLDIAAPQYSLTMEIIRLVDKGYASVRTGAVLPHGWIAVSLDSDKQHSSSRQMFNLHVAAGRSGTIEAGTLQPYRQRVRQWLAGYGVIDSTSVELVSITSGFSASVTPAGQDSVRIRIDPWMRRLQGNTSIQGKTEILVDLGSTGVPKQSLESTAPVRPNAAPNMQNQGMIEIAGASTEITVPLGESVTIMTSDEEAKLLGEALLSAGSDVGTSHFAIRLRVESH